MQILCTIHITEDEHNIPKKKLARMLSDLQEDIAGVVSEHEAVEGNAVEITEIRFV